MIKYNRKISDMLNLPPGTLIHVGKERHEQVKITIFDYDENNLLEKQIDSIEECCPYKDTPTVTWINIDGIHQIEILEKIGNKFNIHPLVLEDMANTGQRPKIEEYEDHLFVVLKMIYFDETIHENIVEQVSVIIGQNYVISFQERPKDVFDSIRERIRQNKGRIRKMGADYLAYSLIDNIIDNYFVILEHFGIKMEVIEEKLLTNPLPETLQTIHSLKRDIIYLRKSIWPLREVTDTLERGESTLINHKTTIFFRDAYDHVIQVIDTIETSRDILSGMLDIYLSSVSNKMNEIMKVLTIIATIFIPLTFIAGVYGMNFHNMPELTWRWGYAVVLVVMLLIGIIMVLYFKRKKWL